MDNSLSKEATDWREGRRLRAWELKQEGWSQQRIAEALGVSKGAVSQWMKRGREGGLEALKRQPAPGAPPRLSEEQCAEVPELLERGAEAHGFRGEVWTCARVAEVIRREFGVSYHPAHVSRLLGALRQSLQLAETTTPGEPAQRGGHRTLERTEVAFPEKKALKESRSIVFCDQSGFYLLPAAVVRTYAPVGKTPVLKENLTRDHLSAMSGITLGEGKLYMIEQERAFKSRARTRCAF